MKRSTSTLLSLLFGLLIGLMAASFAVSQSQAQSSSPIDWQTDVDAAVQIAAKQNKLVLLHFSAEWCRPCKSLERFVFTTPRVQRAMANNCVSVLIDADQNPELVKQYGVAAVPFDIAITPSGRVASKRSSPLGASAYADMIEEFDTIIGSLKKGDNPGLNQSLEEFQDILAADHDVVKSKSLVPKFPSNASPSPSADSMHLARKSKVANSFFNPSRNPQSNSPTASTNNQFAAPQPNRNLSAPAEARPAEAKAKLVIRNPEFDRANAGQLDNSKVNSPTMPQATATAKVKSAPNRSATNDDFKPEIKYASASISVGDDEMVDGTALPVATATIQKTSSVEMASAEETTAATPSKSSEASENPQHALHGKCPVTLLTAGRWVDGDPQWGCVHRRRLYLFASETHLQKFQTDPDAYSPLLAGFDPVVFQRDGKLVDGLEQHGVFMGKTPNQRVVLFRDAETRAEFEANPRNYIETIRAAMNSTGGSSSPILR